MDKLSKDEIFSIAINLNLPDLLNFCRSNRKINNIVCKRKDIWNYKLKKDYPVEMNWPPVKELQDPREKYQLIYETKELARRLEFREVEKAYPLVKFHLSEETIKFILHLRTLMYGPDRSSYEEEISYFIPFLLEQFYQVIRKNLIANKYNEKQIEEHLKKYKEQIEKSAVNMLRSYQRIPFGVFELTNFSDDDIQDRLLAANILQTYQ